MTSSTYVRMGVWALNALQCSCDLFSFFYSYGSSTCRVLLDQTHSR
jgi:hypothetical protein